MTIDETTQLLNDAFATAPTPLVFAYSNGRWTANGGPFPVVYSDSGMWLARAAESGPLCAAEAADRAVRDALHAHGVASRLPDAKLAAAYHALRVEDETLHAQLRAVTAQRDELREAAIDCPNCGESLFPATGRGFWNEETEEFDEHREACRCGSCDWVWHEDEEATCQCGARCIVDVDEDRAWVREVTK